MKVAEFSVKNPVFANLLLIALLVGGGWTYYTMTREVFPQIPLDIIVVRAVYEGATPEEVEKQITIPIEGAIENIENIESIASQSYEGISIIEVMVQQEAKDLQKMVNDVKSEIELIENFPKEAEELRVIEIKSEIPVIGVSVSGTAGERVLRKVVEELKNRFMRVDGVSRIQISGLRDLEIWVEVDPLRLSGLNISIDQVVNAIGAANVNLPAGSLKGSRQEFPLRTTHELKTAQDVEDVIIMRDEAGRDITIGDIAAVTETFKEEETFGRIDGESAITMLVMKTRGGNTIEIAEDVREAVKTFENEMPAGVSAKFYQDSTRYIKQRLKTLYVSGSIGLALVCLVLFLFLNWRMAFWAALGIPTAFAGSFLVMNYFGITVNMLSLFSMILVLGMVVDDAIIVTENVYRYLQRGYKTGHAAVVGASEVINAITASHATTIAAFIPMLMMTGIMGKFISTIPIVVTIALSMSYIEAFLILPSHLADFSKPPKKAIEKEREWFLKMRKVYRRTIKTMLKHRYLSLLAAGLIVASTVAYSYNYMKFVLFNSKDLVGFVAMIEMPVGTNLRETGRVLRQVEEIAASLPKEDLLRSVSTVGMQLDHSTGRTTFGTHLAQTMFESTEFNTPGRRNAKIVAEEVREKLKAITGARSIEIRKHGGGPPVGRALEARISGDDYEILVAVSRDIKKYLKNIPGVSDVKDNYNRGKNELHVIPLKDRLSLYGLDESRVAVAIRTYFKGRIAASIKRGRDDIDVRVKYAQPYRDDVNFLSQVIVTNTRGEQVRLSSISEIKWKRGYSTVNHYNRKRTLKVFADVDTSVITSTELTKMVEERFADVSTRHPGYSIEFGGENEEQMKSVKSLLRATAMALIVIYLILGTLFGSFLQPIVIIAAIPFSFVGVVFGHLLIGEPIGLLSLIGVAALTGIVVNDSLVLVDFINRSRQRGATRWLSILRSAFVRFRPVILTSITTILGLSTIAFKTTGQSAFLAPMAISIVFGLVFSTILTLAVIPCVYAVLDDFLIAFYGKEAIVFRERET